MWVKIYIDGEFSRDFTPTLTPPLKGEGTAVTPIFMAMTAIFANTRRGII